VATAANRVNEDGTPRRRTRAQREMSVVEPGDTSSIGWVQNPVRTVVILESRGGRDAAGTEGVRRSEGIDMEVIAVLQRIQRQQLTVVTLNNHANKSCSGVG
jgi:hypothetical protein